MSEDLFVAWPKIPRAKDNSILITEKMDGTNACVYIRDGELAAVQSRKRLITPEDDNFGFAAWAHENEEGLVQLGEGRHYGEWCGPGIQKNPHELDKRYFYLFNVERPVETLPDCVRQVATLYRGPYTDEVVYEVFWDLQQDAIERGYKPEGVIVYYRLFRQSFKLTYENAQGKWAADPLTKPNGDLI